MAFSTAYAGMGTACLIKFGAHAAMIGRKNEPLMAPDFQVTFWFNNGVNGPRRASGFRTFHEAERFARSVLPDGFFPAIAEACQ